MGLIRIRTERVNKELTIHVGRKISMQNCKSIVDMVFIHLALYCILEMMSVLQEIKGLTKEL